MKKVSRHKKVQIRRKKGQLNTTTSSSISATNLTARQVKQQKTCEWQIRRNHSLRLLIRKKMNRKKMCEVFVNKVKVKKDLSVQKMFRLVVIYLEREESKKENMSPS